MESSSKSPSMKNKSRRD
ncbi:hypothetical protein RDI58_014075 [Solanum bulbocastanum]|uniref:Uncharacterized protein n=1 Tax=Solanum bulbocastanum TaxID=147425 RepID=A0AAN8TND1_SOLBU